MKVGAFKVPQRSPDDLSVIDNLIQTQQLDPTTIVAILGKTEGNGCVNDFTRGFAVQSLKTYLSHLIGRDHSEQIIYVMSGGTEGVLSPHLTVFTRQSEQPGELRQQGLVLGVHHTALSARGNWHTRYGGSRSRRRASRDCSGRLGR